MKIKSLQATIQVREKILLVHSRDCFVLRATQVGDFRHIRGVVLGERGVHPSQRTTPGSTTERRKRKKEREEEREREREVGEHVLFRSL